jgi:hypothetical protein
VFIPLATFSSGSNSFAIFLSCIQQILFAKRLYFLQISRRYSVLDASPQTNSAGFKSVVFGGRRSATGPLSSVTSSVPAAVAPSSLTGNQKTTQALVFQAQKKFTFCLLRKSVNLLISRCNYKSS